MFPRSQLFEGGVGFHVGHLPPSTAACSLGVACRTRMSLTTTSNAPESPSAARRPAASSLVPAPCHQAVEALDGPSAAAYFFLVFAHVLTLPRQYVLNKSIRLPYGVVYPALVPKLWSETIESHRQEVREAILATTASLVAEHGLRAVAMAKIAETVGIGRATLYKYFPDIESILVAWHEEHVARHLDQLAGLRAGPGTAFERLEAALGAYGAIIYSVARKHYGTDLVTLVHQGPPIDQAEHKLGHLVQDLIAEGVKAGEIREDVPPLELAHFCIKAVGGSGGLQSEAAVRRLVTVTIDGLRAARSSGSS